MKIGRKKRILGLTFFVVLISVFLIGQSFSFAEDPANNMNISVETKWIGFISSNMEVDLVADGQVKETVRIRSYEKGHVFINQPKFDPSGREINYSIAFRLEDDGIKYKSKLSGNPVDGYVIKSLALRDIYVGKVWNVIPVTPSPASLAFTPVQLNPSPQPREEVGKPSRPLPDFISVELLQDGNVVDTIQISKATNWTGVFEDYPIFDENDGHQYVYKVREVPVEGFVPEYTVGFANGIFGDIIVNKSLIDVPVEKKWIGKKKDSVEVTIYRTCDIEYYDANTGTLRQRRIDESVGNVILNKNNNWKYIFKNLQEYYVAEFSDPVKYEYYVKETALEGYETRITGNQNEGFVITNITDEPEPDPKPQNPPNPDPKPKKPNPNTGDENDFMMLIALMFSSAALRLSIKYRYKNK